MDTREKEREKEREKGKGKTEAKNEWVLLAEKYPREIVLSRGARMGTLKMSKPVAPKRWLNFANEVMSIPMYLITCHSSVCVSYEACKTPSRTSRRPGIPSFKIPDHTYIMNFTSGGEYCLFGTHKTRLVLEYKDEFRKMLLVDDRSSVDRGEEKHAFVSSVMRAADIQYPNISCIFQEKEGLNELGVFDLSKVTDFVNANSLIKAEDRSPYGDDVWYLDDIIRETYARTRTKKGIFLFSGCTSGFKQAKIKSNLEGAIGKAIADAETMIHIADKSYSTLKPTLDRESITTLDPNMIPMNYGSPYPVAQPDPTSMAALVAATNSSMEELFPHIQKRDKANFNRAMSMLSTTRKAKGPRSKGLAAVPANKAVVPAPANVNAPSKKKKKTKI